jgi:hypothetical protein
MHRGHYGHLSGHVDHDSRDNHPAAKLRSAAGAHQWRLHDPGYTAHRRDMDVSQRRENTCGRFHRLCEATNYQNSTTSGFNGGTKDILITSGVPWGYFIPYWAQNYQLSNPGYTYLLLSLKPSITGDTFGIHAERVGDAPLPGIELITANGNSYGPVAVSGKWGSYKIPLKDLGVLGDKTLYKVVLATHTGSADSWEVDAIGFQ